MASTPEGRLQRSARKKMEAYVKGRKNPLYIFKMHGGPHSVAGVPDFVGCYRHIFFGIEMKVPPNTPTPKQQHHLDMIAAAGGVARVATTPQEAVDVLILIDRIMRKR